MVLGHYLGMLNPWVVLGGFKGSGWFTQPRFGGDYPECAPLLVGTLGAGEADFRMPRTNSHTNVLGIS